MTVPAQDRFTFSSGNGVTTTFPYTFMIPGTVDDPQFLVYLIEIATGIRTDLTVDVDYSIAGLGVAAGGVVTYPLSGTPLAATHRLVIESNMPYEQQTDVYNSGTLYLNAIEDQFDNTTRQVQQIQDRVNRTFSVGIGYEGNYELFPVPDRLIGWNSTGTALENKQSESESAAGAYAAQLAAEAAQAAAEAAAAALPAITANTMLVDNPAGTARETKTFAEVNEKLGVFETKADASATTIDATIKRVRLEGNAALGDGLGGLYVDTDNGSIDTFTSNGGTRTWYRALFDSPTIAPGDAGKIVAVNATEDGFELAAASLPTPFVDVASAATVDLGAASSTSVNITGTTGITSFGTSDPEGTEYLLRFDSALTITAGANLLTPTGGNIVTFAGMHMLVKKDASNVWRIVWYTSRSVTAEGSFWQVNNTTGYTSPRTINWPDGDVTIPAGTLATIINASPLAPTTSGSAIDFTSIPAGVRRVTVSLAGVSGRDSALILVQLGTSSGFETTGYAGTIGTSGSTAGIPVGGGDAANWSRGQLILTRIDTNTWAAGGASQVNHGSAQAIGGSKALSGELTQLRLFGPMAFDAGQARIFWEF